jgi:hypothetical protein
MTAIRPTIDTLLDAFFPPFIEQTHGVLRARSLRVMTALDKFLEAEGEGILVPGDLVILAAEREFERRAAFARTMHAEDLVFALPLFLRKPWLHPDPLLQRVQLKVVQQLVVYLREHVCFSEVEVALPLAEIRTAIVSARRELTRAQQQLRRARENPP